jgi:drug/metabolite transporter (DMT)-like permease
MTGARLILLTGFAMIPLSANSWLCRAALRDTGIDAASFTSIRILSGSLLLLLLATLLRKPSVGQGSWGSAAALFGYAALFSFAYLSLSAGTGALLLFGAVQVSMILIGLSRGERLDTVQIAGVLLAFGGLVVLLLPGWSAPPLGGALMMIVAGIAWGIYSVRGKGSTNPIGVTAGNFLLAVPMTLALSLTVLVLAGAELDTLGVGYAIASGAVTSGLGYALWYSVVPMLRATTAATVQLSVPVIVAIGGVILLSEPITLRLVLASIAVLGGIGLVILERKRQQPPPAAPAGSEEDSPCQ